MSTQSHQSKTLPMILNWILLLVFVTFPAAQGMESRKLDEDKCGACGGGYTPSSPPPPSLSPPIIYPSPPPPSPSPPVVYLSPPPPSPKKPPSAYCPPPPSSSSSSSSSSHQYMTGPPGNLYPVDENFSGARSSYRRSFTTILLPVLIGLLSLLAFS